ncbi:MAG: DNA-directed RNA polymerase subunit beta [Blastochloris viridis]|uniref:DNA-directed RNA polymerase subunit beta n=1 Tax=Blastochloris viridis TaxID=1079 RepID=A0A6N4R509_BLAVI|nr:MAG: DNA-directed RNA polymerase subunit beta [Blastochloris viridis]
MSQSPSLTFIERKRIRRNFGRLPNVATIPNLLEMQKHSYDLFLGEKRTSKETFYTLDSAFASIFPMKDNAGIAELEYIDYRLEEPKYDIDECRTRDLTFAAPCRVTLRLTIWDVDHTTGARSVRDIKEQEVYLADVPLMTENGTFIVNGTERVVVSQMQRSPGVFFSHDDGTTHSSGKLLFSARIIPVRGSWLDFEFDHKDNIYVRIDRKRKLPATVLLRALGLSTQEIVDTYYDKVDVRVGLGGAKKKATKTEEVAEEAPKAKKTSKKAAAESDETDGEEAPVKVKKVASKASKAKKAVAEAVELIGTYALAFEPMFYEGVKLSADLVDADSGKTIIESGKKPTRRQIKKAQEDGIKWVQQTAQDLYGRYLGQALVDEDTGEVLFEAGAEITNEVLAAVEKLGLKTFQILKVDHLNVGAYIRNTLAIDKTSSPEEALVEIYKVMRPGEPPTVETSTKLFNGLFFDTDKFDLSAVGRMKMNARFGRKTKKDEDDIRILEKEDFTETLKALHRIRDGVDPVDDIDHLGNRRVRLVGELMENQVRIGLLRMERSVKERMGSTEIHSMVPNDLINSRPLSAALREFFASSQLSQFMDQTNPLAEVTHKRRLSALGPGGLTRERAGFEVRDVHTTHYGRICPIETPEGPNIGLINSLATYARINKYGFIETPYRKVEGGKVQSEVVYMSAIEEGREVIAQANSELDAKGNFKDEFVVCRKQGESLLMPREEVTYMDVSPKQVVSVAAALIPFLEHDDANRALMGSNMQRQAVPLIRTDAPLVGTGMEATVARDSGVAVVARRNGIVESVDGSRIVVRSTDDLVAGQSGVDIYRLSKFQRSNQSSCLNQRSLVKFGDKVSKGDIIADGASTDLGELALGRNVVVAFMPWNGYNFEDSILISERIVRDDVFTSIHIDEFEVMARDTKLGSEEITRDIPNVGEEALGNLDEAGIIRVGAEVGPGDILVGKITPKGESPMTPEEKLLRAIFGEKAADVRDTSLRLPPGVNGTIVGVKIFNRRGAEKDTRTLEIEEAEIAKLSKDTEDERRILEADAYDRLKDMLVGQKSAAKVGKIAKGAAIEAATLEDMKPAEWWTVSVSDDKVQRAIETLRTQLETSLNALRKRFDDKSSKIRQADELPPGVLKLVKVFVAVKRKLQPGDKMAGRHGNKGVISKVNPIEDMPFLEDGRPVDMVLNPLGVPSRMNVGQILETHLGWAAYNIGRKIAGLLAEANQGKKPDTKALREYLEEMYEDKATAKSLSSLSDSEILEMAKNLSKGMPLACPVFDGAPEDSITEMLQKAECDDSGKTQLYDGRTGDPYEQKTTVGIMYMLKLHHLVDEKIHARSIGPYSLVTQQPLGGKAQFGGQRFGEMEVWALQAYGASYTLQEMLTIKSDDVSGRTKTYEAIVRGETNFEAGVPESFNVLVKEIQALGLNVELMETGEGPDLRTDIGRQPAIEQRGSRNKFDA